MDTRAGEVEPDGMPDLATLIERHRDRTGESYEQMARRSGNVLDANGVWKYATRKNRQFPREAETFYALATILRVDVTTVVLAMAASMGIEVRRYGPRIAQLLPPDVDSLTPAQEQLVVDLVDSLLGQQRATRKPARRSRPPARQEGGALSGAEAARVREAAREVGRGATERSDRDDQVGLGRAKRSG